jgi:ornithine cyclodeaminase
MKYLGPEEIQGLVGLEEAIPAVEAAFRSLALGEATLPEVLNVELPEVEGEFHVKGAYLRGHRYFAVKAASGFYRNPAKGLPVGSGMIVAFDASNGSPAFLLLDHGYLTEVRTAAAGAAAAKYLAPRQVETVGVVGSGVQARYQVRALVHVRSPHRLVAYARDKGRLQAYLTEMRKELGLEAEMAPGVREVVASDLVITATNARSPLVTAPMVHPHLHITAMGADSPGKQELDPLVLARADKVVVDSLRQCLRYGELHHAVEAGVMAARQVHGELGDVVARKLPGRQTEDEVTVADLTGVAVQDAAMAEITCRLAEEGGMGIDVPV